MNQVKTNQEVIQVETPALSKPLLSAFPLTINLMPPITLAVAILNVGPNNDKQINTELIGKPKCNKRRFMKNPVIALLDSVFPD